MTRRTTTGSGWQWLGAGQTLKVWVAFGRPVRREAMATATRQPLKTSRTFIANFRLSVDERIHLQQAVTDRQTTLSDLMRQSLRDAGALPPE